MSASPVDKYQRSDIRIQVRDKNGKQANVVFSVRHKNGQWKIYDVSFENVSILSSYRNSFDISSKSMYGSTSLLMRSLKAPGSLR